jgi:hypothetical protein
VFTINAFLQRCKKALFYSTSGVFTINAFLQRFLTANETLFCSTFLQHAFLQQLRSRSTLFCSAAKKRFLPRQEPI